MSSCADALSQIPQTDENLRFQMRGFGQYDVPLPHRFISADGICILELVLKDEVKNEEASYHDLWSAARALLHDCVLSSAVGGIATDIGKNSGLGIIMTSYEPHVECKQHHIPPPNEHCNHFLDHMKTSPLQKYFANAGDRQATDADIPLPIYMREAGFQCLGIVQTTGGEDQSSWYEIWEGVQAVIGMCIRFGNWGRALKIGALVTPSAELTTASIRVDRFFLSFAFISYLMGEIGD
ncbi:MAG: hypothetical protein Q9196_000369 [Gyalolechia fulgens]